MTTYLLIGSLALIFTIISWRHLVYGLFIISLLLPTYLIRFKVGTLPLTMLEVMILIITAVWVIKTLRRREKVRLPAWLPILFLLTAATVSVFVSPSLPAGLGLFKAYFIEPVLLYLVIVNTLKSERDKKLLVWGLGISVLYLDLWAGLQYAGVVESPAPWIDEVPKRVTSLFDYPNALGLFVTPVACLFIGLLAAGRVSKRFTLGALLVIATALLSVFAANARGAWLGIAAALIIVIFLSRFRRAMKTALLAGLIITIAVLLLLPTTRNALVSVATGRDTSTDVRLVLWQGTWNLLKAKPIFGSGLSGFPTDYEQYRLIKHTEFPLYPHNIFLNFWVELGLLGLVAFIWLIAFFFREAKKQFQPASTFQSALSIGLTAGMIALIVYGLVEVPYFKNDLAALFWILMGLLAANQIKNNTA